MSLTSEEITAVESARIKLVADPPANPGSCAICGVSSDPVGFIDPQLDFEGYGAVFFCASNCAGSLVERLGWISPTRASMLEQSAFDLNDRVLELHQKLENLGDLDAALRNYVADNPVPIVDDLISLGVQTNSDVESGTSEVESTISESEPEPNDSDSNTAILIGIEGTDDVSSITSDVDSTIAELGI